MAGDIVDIMKNLYRYCDKTSCNECPAKVRCFEPKYSMVDVAIKVIEDSMKEGEYTI